MSIDSIDLSRAAQILSQEIGLAIRDVIKEAGLTKRERFAMAALQGSLASDTYRRDFTLEDHTRFAVECADALLEALEKDVKRDGGTDE